MATASRVSAALAEAFRSATGNGLVLSSGFHLERGMEARLAQRDRWSNKGRYSSVESEGSLSPPAFPAPIRAQP